MTRVVTLIGFICCAALGVMFLGTKASADTLPTPTSTPHTTLPAPIKVIASPKGPIRIYDLQSILKLKHTETTLSKNTSTNKKFTGAQPDTSGSRQNGNYTLYVENDLTIISVDDNPVCIYLAGVTDSTPSGNQADVYGNMTANTIDIGEISNLTYDGGYVSSESACADPPPASLVTSQVNGFVQWLTNPVLQLMLSVYNAAYYP